MTVAGAAHVIDAKDETLMLQHCMAGLDAQQRGDIRAAVDSFGKALAIAPDSLDMRLLLAYAQGSAGEKGAAARTLEGAASIDTLQEADARRIADAATALGANHVAIAAVTRVLAVAPSDPNLHATLGALYHRTGNVDGASGVLHRAQLRWPGHVPTLMNRARLQADTGDYENALALYDRVLEHAPDHSSAQWYRGMLRLMLRDFPAGWADHEARRRLPFMESLTPANLPAWDGGSLDGRTVLLWGEQGFGDQIMGARFAAVLEQRGARVVVRCAPSLVTIMRSVEGVSDVVANGDTIPSCDVHVPMLSVPLLCSMFDEASLGSGAYMRPQGEPSAAVRALLGGARTREPDCRARIAIVWAGSATHGNDHNRSLPAPLLEALLGGVDVEWLSLQMGDRRADLDCLPESLRSRATDASAGITDFNDTAHLLASCDMLVSVDTSVVHLAGALGLPAIAMIPHVPDWRWQLARRDTPWYRSMRLVRQPTAGAWAHVIADVHGAITGN